MPGERPSRAEGHDCHCRSTSRTLVVVTPGTSTLPETLYVAAASFGWTLHPDLGVLEIPLKPGSRIATLADAIAVLHAALDEGFAGLRALWLAPGRTVRDSLREVVRAAPLSELQHSAGGSAISWMLENRKIETWFQPVFRRCNGELALWGYECLMRGRDPDGAICNPGQMLQWAEAENLLPMLDRVCREVHIHNAAAAGAPADARFLINFLPTVIYDPKVCLATTRRAVEQSGMAPERIIFEVIESHEITDTAYLRRILDEYRAAGFGVALDDVGGGYSGLTLMGDLSPDLIKIDRALVSRAPDSQIHHAICQALIDIGRKSGKLVLAEGIETSAEWDAMQALDVDLVQGFRFGRPAPQPALEALTPEPA